MNQYIDNSLVYLPPEVLELGQISDLTQAFTISVVVE